MKPTLGALLSGLLLGSLVACGEDAGDSADDTGGTTSNGGKASTGGSSNSGGTKSGTGGTTQAGSSGKASGGAMSEAGGSNGAGTSGKSGTGGNLSEDGGAAGEGGASAGGASTGGTSTGGGGSGGGGEGGGETGNAGAAGAGDYCADAEIDQPCDEEGAFCGGPCTSACEFCNLLRCQLGIWSRMEAFPAPCFECGPDLSCQDNVDFCQSDVGDEGATTTYSCRAAPESCEGNVTCECVTEAVVLVPTDCTEAGDGQVTVLYAGG